MIETISCVYMRNRYMNIKYYYANQNHKHWKNFICLICYISYFRKNHLPSRQNTEENVLVFSDSILKILFTVIKDISSDSEFFETMKYRLLLLLMQALWSWSSTYVIFKTRSKTSKHGRGQLRSNPKSCPYKILAKNCEINSQSQALKRTFLEHLIHVSHLLWRFVSNQMICRAYDFDLLIRHEP